MMWCRLAARRTCVYITPLAIAASVRANIDFCHFMSDSHTALKRSAVSVQEKMESPTGSWKRD